MGRHQHLDDDDIRQILESGTTAPHHLTTCPACTIELQRARTLRDALRRASTSTLSPSADLASIAISRMRSRTRIVGHANEVLTTANALFRGLGQLIGTRRAKPPEPERQDDPEERRSHG